MTIIKALVIPKMVYLFSLIPTPEVVVTELNQVLYKFLWKSTDNVTRLSTINDYENGGLKMVDLECMIKSLKLAWLKGHSHLCDSADLDTSFSHFEKSLPQPEIIVHLEIRIIFRSVLLEFQSFTEKPVFECPVAHPMRLFLSSLVKNSIYRVSVMCKLAMKWYVMRMCTS